MVSQFSESVGNPLRVLPAVTCGGFVEEQWFTVSPKKPKETETEKRKKYTEYTGRSVQISRIKKVSRFHNQLYDLKPRANRNN